MAISEADRRFLDANQNLLEKVGASAQDVRDVESQVGRNRSAVITLTDDSKLHLKQIKGEGSDQRFARSLSFEQFSHNLPLSFGTPRILAHSSAQRCILFEHVNHDTKLSDLVSKSRVAPHRIVSVAEALVNLHSMKIDDTDSLDSSLPTFPPVNAKALSYDYFENATFGELALWRIIQADLGLQTVIQDLVESPFHAVPIHGDFRPDQVLLLDAKPTFIDFEDFRIGDRARDIGSFLGELFYHGIREMVVSATVSKNGELTHETVVENGVRLLEEIRPTLNDFWRAYVNSWHMGPPNGADVKALAVRVCGYMGWHLFDRSLVTSSVMGRLSANDRALSGIGRNIIVNREQFVGELGLTL